MVRGECHRRSTHATFAPKHRAKKSVSRDPDYSEPTEDDCDDCATPVCVGSLDLSRTRSKILFGTAVRCCASAASIFFVGEICCIGRTALFCSDFRYLTIDTLASRTESGYTTFRFAETVCCRFRNKDRVGATRRVGVFTAII